MITISKKSEKMITDTFNKYSYNEKESCPKIFHNRIVIHIYPVGDTIEDDNNKAQGLEDSILFDVHIYDTIAFKKYIILNRDAILLEVPVETRIFKDLSTMYIIDEPCAFDIFQKITIYSPTPNKVPGQLCLENKYDLWKRIN